MQENTTLPQCVAVRFELGGDPYLWHFGRKERVEPSLFLFGEGLCRWSRLHLFLIVKLPVATHWLLLLVTKMDRLLMFLCCHLNLPLVLLHRTQLRWQWRLSLVQLRLSFNQLQSLSRLLLFNYSRRIRSYVKRRTLSGFWIVFKALLSDFRAPLSRMELLQWCSGASRIWSRHTQAS